MAKDEPLLPRSLPPMSTAERRGKFTLLKSDLSMFQDGHRILSGKCLEYDYSAADVQDPTNLPYRLEIMRVEKEAVIETLSPTLVHDLSAGLGEESEAGFVSLAAKVDSAMKNWYKKQFEDMMHLYCFFDPLHGSELIEKYDVGEEQLADMEQKFLDLVLALMEKSNYKMLTDKEYRVATEGWYRINLQIHVDEEKIDSSFLGKYFQKVNVPNRPSFSDKYLIFRRGVGLDLTTKMFFMEKVDRVLGSIYDSILAMLCLKQRTSWDPVILDTFHEDADIPQSSILSIQRIHLSSFKLNFKFLFSATTIQEPSFSRIIILHRPVPGPRGSSSIVIKHFSHIPMADMEIVLPEKKTPTLTPKDSISFFVTIVFGLIGMFSAIKASASFQVIVTISVAFVSYILKVYFAWQKSMKTYKELIQQSMYERQLDSGRSTLLHLCDDVLRQEAKEVLLAYYILLTTGKATKKELDSRSETFMACKYQENLEFDVEDAMEKLIRLGIVKLGVDKKYKPVSLDEANKLLGRIIDESLYESSSASENGYAH